MCPQGPPVLQQQENANNSNDSCNNATTHNSHNVWSDPFYGDIPGPKAPGCIRVHCVNTGPLPINGKDDAKYGDLLWDQLVPNSWRRTISESCCCRAANRSPYLASSLPLMGRGPVFTQCTCIQPGSLGPGMSL